MQRLSVPEAVAVHLRTVQDAAAATGVLPPHYPTCLGCGPDAPQGFHLQARRDGDDVVARHMFQARHSGAPGIAHGGAVATVADDVLGFLVFAMGLLAVTRHLAVDYLRPVLVDVPYDVRGRLERREGRKIFVSCTGTDPQEVPAFRAAGVFVVVEPSHFGGTGTDRAR